MVGKLIIRGLIAGICAGLLAFGFARVIGEPAVAIAIQFESAQDEAKAAAARAAGQPVEEEPEIFSRAVQSGVGLLTGVVGVGAGMGALFAVLFAIANGRIGTWGPGATCALLALLGWTSLYMVPALKYPANPPSVGQPDTIQIRTALYFLAMALSIASTIGAWALGRRLARSYGLWNGSVVALLAYLVVLTVVFQLLPPINEVPRNFPAVTLWNFRVASAGLQVVLWGGVALIFGTIAEISRPGHRVA
ncbi:MAG TPA: CbtA family protein [Steroidobacteraceae bacterium]|nr:CbtA family protein [Steroidobacteraceae bacterium]